MSCTFLSSCFLIFDISHQMYKMVFLTAFCFRRKKTYEDYLEAHLEQKLTINKDSWFFDMGYNTAFT